MKTSNQVQHNRMSSTKSTRITNKVNLFYSELWCSFPGVNIDVKVIQDGCWPFPKTLPNFNLPSCLEHSVKDFTDFYEEKEGRKRRLKWFYHHSQADVKTCRTKRMYVLKVMTFQLGILHCFNNADQLTIAEIREETALDMKVCSVFEQIENYF